jgi:hypothetical protein
MNGKYVVRWEHWRADGSLDRCVRKPKDYPDKWIHCRAWFEPFFPMAQHGGKTVCRIYRTVEALVPRGDGKTTDLVEVAHAETVCSWRDQFDRRVGRLYSLALALCELDVPLEEWDGIDIWQPLVKVIEPFHPTGDQWEQLCGYIRHDKQSVVKQICAEIVDAWKHPPRSARTKPTPEQIAQWRAEKCAQEAE